MPPKLALLPVALLLCSVDLRLPVSPLWKCQYMLTLDASASRWTGLLDGSLRKKSDLSARTFFSVLFNSGLICNPLTGRLLNLIC